MSIGNPGGAENSPIRESRRYRVDELDQKTSPAFEREPAEVQEAVKDLIEPGQTLDAEMCELITTFASIYEDQDPTRFNTGDISRNDTLHIREAFMKLALTPPTVKDGSFPGGSLDYTLPVKREIIDSIQAKIAEWQEKGWVKNGEYARSVLMWRVVVGKSFEEEPTHQDN